MTTIDQQSLNEQLASISGGGTVKEVYDLINSGANDINRALFIASIRGNLPVVKYLVNQGANDLNRSLDIASAYGNLNVVQYLVQEGANHLTKAIISNIQSTWYDPKMVKYLLDKGDNDLVKIFEYAASAGRNDLIDYLISIGVNIDNLYPVLSVTAAAGQFDTFKHLLSIYSDKIDPSMLNSIIDELEQYKSGKIYKNIINFVESYLGNENNNFMGSVDERSDDINEKLYESSYKGNFGDVYRLTKNKNLSYDVIDKAIDEVNRGLNEIANDNQRLAEDMYLPIRNYLVELGMEI